MRLFIYDGRVPNANTPTILSPWMARLEYVVDGHTFVGLFLLGGSPTFMRLVDPYGDARCQWVWNGPPQVTIGQPVSVVIPPGDRHLLRGFTSSQSPR